MHFTYIVTVRVCFLFMLHPYHFLYLLRPVSCFWYVRARRSKNARFFCKIVLTLLYTRLDRVEITCSKNDLEVTGVIAGSVAGENITRDDYGRLRQKVAQSIDFFELYQLVSFLHN